MLFLIVENQNSFGGASSQQWKILNSNKYAHIRLNCYSLLLQPPRSCLNHNTAWLHFLCNIIINDSSHAILIQTQRTIVLCMKQLRPDVQPTVLAFNPSIILFTERRCREVSTPASYSASPGFKFQSEDRLSLLRVFVVFLSSSRQALGQYLKSGHDHFFRRPFQFINRPNLTLHSLIYWQRS
jgi:hypothetical protein